MNIEQVELLSGETLLLSKAANAIIHLNNYGLERLQYDQLMALAGFEGKEAIGGKLHLTSYRLIFKSHFANRIKGTFSIFLPTIEELQDSSGFITKKLTIRTQTQNLEFVVWGVPALITAIQSSAVKLTPEQKKQLRVFVRSNPDKFVEGLAVSPAIDRLVRNAPDVAEKILEIAQDPISISGILNIIEGEHSVIKK
jgi:hypothetical protein